jgi:bla regulator protein blaR1
MTNTTVQSFISVASPVPPDSIEGLPEWAKTERYDVIAKPPTGSTRDQWPEMMRAMLRDRLKVAGHVEQRERDVFDLVLARTDGRLGPNLTASTLDCSPGAAPPVTAAPSNPTFDSVRSTCGMMFGSGRIVSGGITLDRLLPSLNGLAGGRITNRTGLTGTYAVELTFSRPTLSTDPLPADSPPDIFTAIQEQLGLKLVKGKASLPIFVVDHIERPSAN